MSGQEETATCPEALAPPARKGWSPGTLAEGAYRSSFQPLAGPGDAEAQRGELTCSESRSHFLVWLSTQTRRPRPSLLSSPGGKAPHLPLPGAEAVSTLFSSRFPPPSSESEARQTQA